MPLILLSPRATPPQPAGKPRDVLTPTGLSMLRFDTWADADRQAALFHGWLMDEDSWSWMANTLGLIVEVQNLPMTIAARRSNRANVEIHSVRTAMKRGALGWPEQHMVVVVTQWRAGFFDDETQKQKDTQPGAWNDPCDFKYRAGCTLLIDPEEMRIRRVIRTPGTVADEGELVRMRRYLLGGLTPSNAFAPITERLGDRVEPFALLHSQGGA